MKPKLRPLLLASGFFGLGIALAVTVAFLVGGQFVLEKTLKSLIAPVGLIWLGLLAQTVISLAYGQRRCAALSLILCLLLTLAGNQVVTYWMGWKLETPFLDSRSDALGEFDAVLILGGSTGMTPAGEVQGGERVFAGYRLFHAGNAKKLLVSGRQNSRSSDSDLHPAEEARLLLLQSGVPDSAIEMLGGLNTSEEIACLKEWMNNNAAAGIRVGVLSDATHLERVLSLCESNGVQAIGIPAGFTTSPFVPNPSVVIPSASNLLKTETFIYETLGRLLGR